MNDAGCPYYDEYNKCCMWERMEKILLTVWECEREIIEECMKEMP